MLPKQFNKPKEDPVLNNFITTRYFKAYLCVNNKIKLKKQLT